MTKAKESQNKEIDVLKKKCEATVNEVRAEFQKRMDKEGLEKNEIEKAKSQLEKKNHKLIGLLREKDQNIEDLKESIKKQDSQTEDALNDIKLKVEENSKKIYAEMDEAMSKCEQDLARSKQAREKQIKDSQKQLDKLKCQHEKEIHKLRNEFCEIEKCLKSEFDEEKKRLLNHNSEVLTELKEKNLESNFKYQAKIESLSLTINQQDQKIGELQRQLTDANALRKTQIIELGILREDEKIKLVREKDLELQALKKEIDMSKKNRLDEIILLKEAHKEEVKNILVSSNQEKRTMCEQIEVLEETVRNMKMEHQKLTQINEQTVKDALTRMENEKTYVKRPYQNRIMVKDLKKLKKSSE